MSIWKLDDSWIASTLKGKKIKLLTPEQFSQLPPGTKVVTIAGEEKIVGKDELDDDTRFGYLAFGLLIEPQYP